MLLNNHSLVFQCIYTVYKEATIGNVLQFLELSANNIATYTHPRVCMWSDSPPTVQNNSLLWNIQSDLFLFKYHLLVRTHSGSNLSVLSIYSLQSSH